MTKKDKDTIPHYVGHRQRLKNRFLAGDPKSFDDYELLELLLFQVIPRKDVKPLAKTLLKKFGNFNKLLSANQEQILEIENSTPAIYLQLRLLKALLSRIFQEDVAKKHVINSWTALLNYLKFDMGGLQLEQFRVLFLNNKNVLIADEILATGTIDQTPVYPREIVKRILFHEAGAIILVHNHPTGNTKPSNADLELTNQIVEACNTVRVRVHDHVIIGGNNYFSFKSNMLL